MTPKLAAERIEHLFDEQKEPDELRHLNRNLTSGCHPLFFASDPDVMRGYDFHSQKLGMIICVAKLFAR